MVYVDTSVLVAALTPERRTALMQEWLADQAAGELAVSDWVVTEFSSALSIKIRTEQLSPEQRARVLAAFTTLVRDSFHVLPVDSEVFRAAARMTDQYATGLRAGDALHLAVAAAHGARLVSLDSGLSHAGVVLGVDAHML